MSAIKEHSIQLLITANPSLVSQVRQSLMLRNSHKKIQFVDVGWNISNPKFSVPFVRGDNMPSILWHSISTIINYNFQIHNEYFWHRMNWSLFLASLALRMAAVLRRNAQEFANVWWNVDTDVRQSVVNASKMADVTVRAVRKNACWGLSLRKNFTVYVVV